MAGRYFFRSVIAGVWRLKNFQLIWTSQLASALGSAVHVVALPVIAIELLKASVFEVSLISASRYIPNLLFSIPIGHFVDGHNRKKSAVISDGLRAGLVAAIPILFFYDQLTVVLLTLISFLLGTTRIFFDMSLSSIIPVVIPKEDRLAANASLESISAVSNIAGPGVGGIVITLLSPVIALVIDGISFFLSALLLSKLNAIEAITEKKKARTFNVWAGFSELYRQPVLLGLLLTGAIANIGFMAVQSVYFVAALGMFGFDAGTASALLMMSGVGALLGNMLCVTLSARYSFKWVMLVSLVVMISGSVAMLLANADKLINTLLVGSGYLLWGGCLGVFNTFSTTFRQQVVKPELMGRVLGAARTLVFGSFPLGALAGGTLGELLGLRSVFVFNIVAVLLAISVLTVTFRKAGKVSLT